MDLVERLAWLEARTLQTPAIAKDFRVIEMQLSRAEDKVMRIGRSASWTRADLALWKTEDL
jgi:hypothetical protein